MAVFDPSDGQIVVRVVYDGVGQAGKTTNLQQLISEFTSVRRSDLKTRETARGRTLFFDWMQLQGGLIAGHRFRCELLTVPGQAVLRRRRLYLIDKADVVVLVVDSTQAGVRDGLTILKALQDGREENPRPLVLQANKQDVEGALAPEDVRAQLGLPESVPVIGAIATTGQGVRDTALLAMREAANALSDRVMSDGPQSLGTAYETTEALYDEMKTLQVEVSFEAVARPRGPKPPPPSGTVGMPPARRAKSSSEASSRPSPVPPPNQSADSVGLDDIPMPSPAVPSHYIWPGMVGRELLRKMPLASAVRRPEFTQRQGKVDGSGKPDTALFSAGEYCLKTSTRRRFDNEDIARTELNGLARRKNSLGELMPSPTVLMLQPDDSGGLWLWTISRWTPSLRAEMADAESKHANAALSDCLLRYARASFDALELLDQGVCLDINPSNFAQEEEHVVYIDDDIESIRAMPVLGYAWLKRVDEYCQMPDSVERYIRELETGLSERIPPRLGKEIGLVSSLEDTMVSTDLGREARMRLINAARRCRE